MSTEKSGSSLWPLFIVFSSTIRLQCSQRKSGRWLAARAAGESCQQKYRFNNADTASTLPGFTYMDVTLCIYVCVFVATVYKCVILYTSDIKCYSRMKVSLFGIKHD